MKNYTEKEIYEVIDNFKNCTIKRGTWGHPEHLILAYHFASNHNFNDALSEMRDGIFRLLDSFEIDLTKEMPYHETMTVFWMKTVFDFTRTVKSKRLVENINLLIEKFDKNYPLKYYSEKLLFSDEARATYIEPNL